MFKRVALSFSLVAAPLQANVLNDMLCYEGATIGDGKDYLRIVIADDGSFQGFATDTEARSFAIGPELVGRAGRNLGREDNSHQSTTRFRPGGSAPGADDRC